MDIYVRSFPFTPLFGRCPGRAPLCCRVLGGYPLLETGRFPSGCWMDTGYAYASPHLTRSVRSYGCDPGLRNALCSLYVFIVLHVFSSLRTESHPSAVPPILVLSACAFCPRSRPVAYFLPRAIMSHLCTNLEQIW